MPMVGHLADVFEITDRGVIGLLDRYDGVVRAGERFMIGDREWIVAGVEMVNGAKVMEQISQGRPPTIAVLLRDATKAELLSLVGQTFETKAGSTTC